jgi:hypothetical protein
MARNRHAIETKQNKTRHQAPLIEQIESEELEIKIEKRLEIENGSEFTHENFFSSLHPVEQVHSLKFSRQVNAIDPSIVGHEGNSELRAPVLLDILTVLILRREGGGDCEVARSLHSIKRVFISSDLSLAPTSPAVERNPLGRLHFELFFASSFFHKHDIVFSGARVLTP